MNIYLWQELPGEWVCRGKTGTKFDGNLAAQMATLLFEKCPLVAFTTNICNSAQKENVKLGWAKHIPNFTENGQK
jgi:hypothetical protein